MNQTFSNVVNIKTASLKMHHKTYMQMGEIQVSQIALILPHLGFMTLFSYSNEFVCVCYIFTFLDIIT